MAWLVYGFLADRTASHYPNHVYFIIGDWKTNFQMICFDLFPGNLLSKMWPSSYHAPGTVLSPTYIQLT